MRLLYSLLALGAMAGVISACSASRGPAVFSNDKHVGVYKVGEPYQIDGTWYTPSEDEDYEEEGAASWYGPGFHKKRTANGDVFDQNALTAAHRTLPLPSMVRVTNLDNGRTLVVMVNDRGPFSKGRILDLSERAADILGFKDKGIARVNVKFLPGQTRRLLAQLDVPQGKDNPFATADADFGQSEMPLAASNESSAGFGSFMDGIELPLPENFSISGVDTFKTPAVEGGETKIAENSMAKANVDDGAPIMLEPNVESNATRALSGFEKRAGVRIPENAQGEPAWKPEQVSAVAEEEEKLPQALPEVSEDAAFKPMVVEPKMVKVVEAETEPAKKPVVSEVLAVTPKDKVLLDKSDPRYVEQVYYIQAGSFRMEENAIRVQQNLAILGEKSEVETVQVASGDLSRVRIGPIYNELRAKKTLQQVVRMGYADAMIVVD